MCNLEGLEVSPVISGFSAACFAALVVLSADKIPDPTLLEGGEPPHGTPALHRLISEWHRLAERFSEELRRVVHECVDDRPLSEADVEMLVHRSDIEVERHLVSEEQAFLPLMRLCLDGGRGDPVDFVVEGHRLVHRDVDGLKSAAKAWKQFGDRRANRLHFARAADALAPDLRAHLVTYLALLLVADECLSDSNWKAGLQKLDSDY
jgi:hypothetical protein